ncbi:hypothetical protein [Xanthomonas campestris]|uniref:HORMA-1 domain-containing protein n=1 Tax=Xanthomonas campestris TaxID=339 RepID=UPI0005AF2B03|nr:hypothetical protein [Xanthomonas campestris]KIQ27753.1 hypothetical protein RT95_06870 [Xanthomonas campestris]
MASSYTLTESSTFTITHAKYLASKIATDLKRIQRLYDCPSDKDIANYESEAMTLIKGGYVQSVTYGFKRNGQWVEPTLRYTASSLATWTGVDDDPGRIRANADVAGAAFASFLTYTAAWSKLSDAEKRALGLPFERGFTSEPTVRGYLTTDRTYSAGGQALERASVRSF